MKRSGFSFLSQKELSGASTSPNINIFLWTLVHIKIIAFSTKVSAIFKNIFGFNFICISVCFLKNTLCLAFTKTLKSPLILIICQMMGTSFPYINFLGWKFQSNSVITFWVGARQSYQKYFSEESTVLSLTCSCLLNLAHLLQSRYSKKMRVKRSKNVKNIYFIKTMLNGMKRFTCRKCSKVAINMRE